MKKMNLFWRASILMGCLSACATFAPLRQGVQSDALALNPARIAGYPTLLFPHPSLETSLDPATLMSGEVVASVETRILAAFKNQPGVNGISFQTVRTVLKSNPKIQTDVDSEIRAMGQLVNSGSARENLLLTAECRARHSFLDFYKFCLLKSQRWVPLLNQVSIAVQNSDSLLIPVVTSLEKTTERNSYVLKFGLSLLLVDTNNGRLIWGRDVIATLNSVPGVKQFPDLKTAYDKIFTENFWAEFPGRRSRPESSK